MIHKNMMSATILHCTLRVEWYLSMKTYVVDIQKQGLDKQF